MQVQVSSSPRLDNLLSIPALVLALYALAMSANHAGWMVVPGDATIAVVGGSIWGALAIAFRRYGYLTPLVPVMVSLIMGLWRSNLWPWLASPYVLFNLVWHSGVFLRAIADGVLGCLACAVVVGQLGFRQPSIGVIPAGVFVAIDTINFSASSSIFAVVFTAAVMALFIINNVTSIQGQRQTLSYQSRKYIWKAIMALFIPAACLGMVSAVGNLPVPSTKNFAAGFNMNWQALIHEIDQELSKIPWFSKPLATANTTGFSYSAPLGGSLQENRQVVMVVNESNIPGPALFTGVVLNAFDGSFTYIPYEVLLAKQLKPGSDIPYGVHYKAQKIITLHIYLKNPPSNASNVVFYPGRLLSVSKRYGVVGQGNTNKKFLSVYYAILSGGPVHEYTVTVAIPDPTASELEKAGTNYPSWVKPFAKPLIFLNGPESYYSDTATAPLPGYEAKKIVRMQNAIHELALKVTRKAKTPYAKVLAVQSYLRSAPFKYTTDVTTPRGQNPLFYFLFDSHKGYCQYFATAMAAMLRSIGIPARLVNGFGPGTFDKKLDANIIRESDAHTWVQVYFPGYGWLPFDPTPQAGYHAIIAPNSVNTSSTKTFVPPGIRNPAVPRNVIPVEVLNANISTKTSIPLKKILLFVPVFLGALLVVAVVVLDRLIVVTPRRSWLAVTVLGRMLGVVKHEALTPLEYASYFENKLGIKEGVMQEVAYIYSAALYSAQANIKGYTRFVQILGAILEALMRNLVNAIASVIMALGTRKRENAANRA